MYLRTLTSYALMLSMKSLVSAAALPVLVARDLPYGQKMYVCTGKNWTGNCLNMDAAFDRCYNLDNGWDLAISSAGPDPGLVCVLYAASDCAPTNGQIATQYPGTGDLSITGMDHKALSFRCAVPIIIRPIGSE